MPIDADYKAEMTAAYRIAEPIRAALAYLALGLGLSGTLALVPTLLTLLAERGFQ